MFVTIPMTAYVHDTIKIVFLNAATSRDYQSNHEGTCIWKPRKIKS